MFSEDIEIRTGDSHGIFENVPSFKRVNPAQDIVIGNHVWVAAHARILKGGSLPDNSILANSSVMTKKAIEKNSIYGGIPAKLLKSNISWSRSRLKQSD